MSSYHGCKWAAINLMPHYLIGIIYKTVKSLQFRKIINHTKYE